MVQPLWIFPGVIYKPSLDSPTGEPHSVTRRRHSAIAQAVFLWWEARALTSDNYTFLLCLANFFPPLSVSLLTCQVGDHPTYPPGGPSLSQRVHVGWGSNVWLRVKTQETGALALSNISGPSLNALFCLNQCRCSSPWCLSPGYPYLDT